MHRRLQRMELQPDQQFERRREIFSEIHKTEICADDAQDPGGGIKPATGSAESVKNNDAVIEAYLGTGLKNRKGVPS